MVKNKINYIDETECYNEIVKSNEQGRLTEKMGKMIMDICDGLQNKYTYENDDIRNDVKSTAIRIACEKWTKFNHNKSKSAFSFFTSVLHNGIREGMNDYTKSKIAEYSLDSIFEDNL